MKKTLIEKLKQMIEKCEKQRGYVMEDYKNAKTEADRSVISLIYVHWDMHKTDLVEVLNIIENE